jgi:hypothetical protein
VRRYDPHGRIADARREHLRRPGRRTTALTDREQRAYEGAHHVVAERVGHHDADRHPVAVALPVQTAQRADRRRPLPAAAEGREVMLAEQQRCGLVDGRQIERSRVPERVMPSQRVSVGRVIADPVGVPPPEGGEAGVEPVGGGPDRAHPDVRRQRPGQPPRRRSAVLLPDLRREVRVGHLPAGVHPGVGPPGDGQPDRFRQPQHVPEDPRELTLHRPLRGLRRPPGKVRPVVGEVDSHPNQGILHDRRRLGGRLLAHRRRLGSGSWRVAGGVTGPFGLTPILILPLRLAGK